MKRRDEIDKGIYAETKFVDLDAKSKRLFIVYAIDFQK